MILKYALKVLFPRVLMTSRIYYQPRKSPLMNTNESNLARSIVEEVCPRPVVLLEPIVSNLSHDFDEIR